MTEIKLHNTLKRRKEVFEPIDPENVRMYVCGPTVYDRAHIGNARPVVVFDVLYRLLREVYGADQVTYVRNFTDVDDKINARAAESGRAIGDITAETTQWYLDDMGALGAMEPNHMPRATQYIGEMITMIEKLIADGFADAHDGHETREKDQQIEPRKHQGSFASTSTPSARAMVSGTRVAFSPDSERQCTSVRSTPSPEPNITVGKSVPEWSLPDAQSEVASTIMWSRSVPSPS